MVQVNIDSVGTQGVVRDREAYTLDPVAWNELLNMRCLDEGIFTIPKCTQVFGTLPDVPAFLMPVVTNTETFWLWLSLTDAYVWDGTNHTELTRAVGGDYTTSFHYEWNGVNFAGIPVVNNGVNKPQFWSPLATNQKLQDLTNWPATTRARVIRALGPFLIAFNVVEAGNSRPHAIMWSHPADPGSLPVSWDYTDPTRDAGINELPDVDAGVIMDARPLRGQMMIYKERATWRMRHVGGRSIFAFDSLFDTSGVMARRCVSLMPDGMRHFVASKDDLVQHNGQQLQSVLNKRMHRTVFNNIDLDNADVAFTFTDPINKEGWFCYPEAGNPTANRAVIWNYDTNALSEAEVDFKGVFQGPNAIAFGSRVWDEVASEWDIDPHRWDPTSHTILIAIDNDGHFCVLNTGRARRSTANRMGLAIVGQKRDGSAIVNYNARKMVTRVWPRIKGDGPVFVRLGSQKLVDGEVIWTAPKMYQPKIEEYVDFIVEGRAIAIEFSCLDNALNWGLEGYKLDLEVIAEF